MCVVDFIAQLKMACAPAACFGQNEVCRIQIDVQLNVAGVIMEDGVVVQMHIVHDNADFIICCLRWVCLL